MIVVDTSALIAIATREPEAAAFNRIVSEAGTALIGAPTFLETGMILSRGLASEDIDYFIRSLTTGLTVKAIDFSSEMFAAARLAFRRYGKGQGHPAQLNFGDRMSYAVAKVYDVPLLYKGNDFSATDLRPAHRP